MLPSLVSSLQRPPPVCPNSVIVGQNPSHAVPPSQAQYLSAAITKSTGLKHLTLDLRHIAVDSLRHLLRACVYSTSLQQLSVVGGVSSSHVRVLTPFFSQPVFTSLFNITIHPTSIELTHASALVDAAVQSRSLRVFNLRIPTSVTPAWTTHAGIWKQKLQDVLQRNWEIWNEQQNQQNQQQHKKYTATPAAAPPLQQNQYQQQQSKATALKHLHHQHIKNSKKIPTPPLSLPSRPVAVPALNLKDKNKNLPAEQPPAVIVASHSQHFHHRLSHQPQQQQQQQQYFAATYEAPKFISPRSWSGAGDATGGKSHTAGGGAAPPAFSTSFLPQQLSNNNEHRDTTITTTTATSSSSSSSSKNLPSCSTSQDKHHQESGNSGGTATTTTRSSAFSSAAPSTCVSPRNDNDDDGDGEDAGAFSPSPRMPEDVLRQLQGDDEAAAIRAASLLQHGQHQLFNIQDLQHQQRSGEDDAVVEEKPSANLLQENLPPPTSQKQQQQQQKKSPHGVSVVVSESSRPPTAMTSSSSSSSPAEVIDGLSPDPRPPRLPTPPVSHRFTRMPTSNQQQQQQQSYKLPPLPLKELDRNNRNVNNKNTAASSSASAAAGGAVGLPPLTMSSARKQQRQQQQLQEQEEEHDQQVTIRTARVRSLGAKITQLDALLQQFDAETCAMKTQMLSVIHSARHDMIVLQ